MRVTQCLNMQHLAESTLYIRDPCRVWEARIKEMMSDSTLNRQVKPTRESQVNTILFLLFPVRPWRERSLLHSRFQQVQDRTKLIHFNNAHLVQWDIDEIRSPKLRTEYHQFNRSLLREAADIEESLHQIQNILGIQEAAIGGVIMVIP